VVMSATDPTLKSKVAEADGGGRHITRREALRQAGLGIAVAGVGAFAAGCGSSSSTTSSAAGKPLRGGTLTAALTGGASSDIIGPPWNPLNPTDTARFYQLYNQLIGLDDEGLPALDLATEITSNSQATEWTIRVRDGVTFHNGKDLGADDVLYTMNASWHAKTDCR